MSGKPCNHIDSEGKPCHAYAVANDELCFFHSPKTRDAHKASVVKAGSAKQFKGQLETPELSNPRDIYSLLVLILGEVRSGVLPPRVANTLAYVAGHAVQILKAAVEHEHLEEMRDLQKGELRIPDPTEELKRQREAEEQYLLAVNDVIEERGPEQVTRRNVQIYLMARKFGRERLGLPAKGKPTAGKISPASPEDVAVVESGKS